MAIAASDQLPLRQIARLRTEMAIAAHQLAAAIFPHQPGLSVAFGIITRRCLPEWVSAGTLALPSAPERSITIRQIARSLGGAPESVRRHVRQLEEIGAVSLSAGGAALAPSVANAARVHRYVAGVHDLFVRLAEDVGLTCDLHWPGGGAEAPGLEAVVERAIDVLLLPVDTFRLAGSQSAFLLWGALTAVAVRRVTYDPVLARRYASTIPPDELRVGVSLRKLAGALSIPYATAWRQMHALQEQGLVTRLGSEQWVVLTRNLLTDTAMAVSAPPSLFTVRKLRELALLGLDPGRAAACYMSGRPALPELGIA